MRSTENVGLECRSTSSSPQRPGRSRLANVARMSDEEAHGSLQADPLGRHGRRAGLPALRLRCRATRYKTRQLFKCKACSHQFSVTCGTIFASRKLPIRDYLLAIAIFVNGAKGHSALQLSRDLDVPVQDGLRAGAQAARSHGGRSKTAHTLAGEVEIDGALLRRLREAGQPQGEPRRPPPCRATRPASAASSSSMRERHGRTLPFVSKSEDAARPDHRPPRRRRAASSMPTRPRIGMRCTPASSPSASTTASRSRTAKPAPIRPRASSAACAAPSSACTTTSPAPTSRLRRRDGMARGQSPRQQTASNTSRWRMQP